MNPNDPQLRLPYQTPDQVFVDLIDAPVAPALSMDRTHSWMLMGEIPSLPPIEEIAQPELRLAGLRINPLTNGPSRGSHIVNLTMKRVGTKDTYQVENLPPHTRINFLTWAPDSQSVAFAHTTNHGIELWILEVESLQARRLGDIQLNAALSGNPISWLPDSSGLLVRAIPARGQAPDRPIVPEGPVISESSGEKAAVRTYQDLLQDRYDEDIFSYYATSELLHVSSDGTTRPVGQPDLYLNASPSPDGQYLLVSRLKHPFSYLVTYDRFPRQIDLWTTGGELVRTMADVPSGETIPKGFMAVRKGPRNFSWRADHPASLYWFETQDEGDPAREVAVRDKVFHLNAPFEGEPVFDLDLRLRAAGITWGTGQLAVIQEYWWANRQIITAFFAPDSEQEGREARVVFDRSWEDRYNDPGHFETTLNEAGRSVLLTDHSDRYAFLLGQGASPEGNRPFLDRYTIADGTTERLWQCEGEVYELVLQVIDPEGPFILTRRETPDQPPNFFLRALPRNVLTPVTDFPHPYPNLKAVRKTIIRYQREDGVALTGNLYLPPGYDAKRDGRIPVLMWAYPEEFKSSDAAGQVHGSPYHFIRIGWYSPLFWLLKGYAILDDPAMPIVGEGTEEPNDTFLEQLVSNAKAAIDYLDEQGIADRSRIAVGGHSYGAFMTANLLAHSELFACGIARSGAYNRTLTPFGFQAEERTLWEAPDTYMAMSPFSHADKIKAPILLIHGAADNNSGTYPMQSERFFNALKGHGARARLVMLPHESHSYAARESILHMLWEMDLFLDQAFQKN